MFLDEFISQIGICEDAGTVLKQTYLAVKDKPLFAELTQAIVNKADFKQLEKKCVAAAETLGVHRYTLMMTLLCGNAEIMKTRYEQDGNGDLFWDTAVDFRCKINECQDVYGVWGIFPFDWYQRLFEAKLFKLGRLEFERRPENKSVIGMHIPSCGPMKHEDVLDSYRRAYAFFGGANGECMPFFCSTYLLYPPYQGTVYPENSNIRCFAEDFTIIRVDNKPEFSEAWRVFGTFYNGDTSVLPRNTSLQRAFVSYIEAGGTFGTGLGLFLFDGESVRTDNKELFDRYAQLYQRR